MFNFNRLCVVLTCFLLARAVADGTRDGFREAPDRDIGKSG
jgi:hypothetical protein